MQRKFLRLIVAQWRVKVAYETLATPLTYAAFTLLKRSERADAYDVDTGFNPISIR